MKTFPVSVIDKKLAYGEIARAKEMPATVYDLDHLYIEGSRDYNGPFASRKVQYVTVREATDAQFGRFIRQYLKIRYRETYDEVTRLDLICDIFVIGLVAHLFIISEPESK